MSHPQSCFTQTRFHGPSILRDRRRTFASGKLLPDLPSYFILLLFYISFEGIRGRSSP